MKLKNLTALLLTVLLVLSLVACGAKDGDKAADMSGNGSAMTDEPKNAEEAAALYQKLMEQENARLAENSSSLFTVLPSRSLPSKAGNFCMLPSSGGVVMSLPAGTLIAPSMDCCTISGYFSISAVSLFSILLISVADSFSHSYSLSVNCSLAASTVSSRKSP